MELKIGLLLIFDFIFATLFSYTGNLTTKDKKYHKESSTAFSHLIFSSIIDTANFKLLHVNYVTKTSKSLC